MCCKFASGQIDNSFLMPQSRHDAPLTGQPKIHRTLVLISTPFYWSKMRLDIHNYMTKCHECQVNKAEGLKVIGTSHPLDIPNNKWEVNPWILLLSLLTPKKAMMPFGLLLID